MRAFVESCLTAIGAAEYVLARAPVTPVNPARAPRPLSVLVVDSDEVRRRGLVRSLAERGCVGYPARSAGGTRLLLSTSRFDVVIGQMRIDEGSGINLVSEVRCWDQRIPVVIWFERMPPVGRPESRAIWFLREPLDVAVYAAIDGAYRAHLERDARRSERMATIPLHPR